MYRKERDLLLAQVAALKAKPAPREEIQACEIDLHILETNRLRKIGNRYFDLIPKLVHGKPIPTCDDAGFYHLSVLTQVKRSVPPKSCG